MKGEKTGELTEGDAVATLAQINLQAALETLEWIRPIVRGALDHAHDDELPDLLGAITLVARVLNGTGKNLEAISDALAGIRMDE